jgi:hypothetical protein
MPTSYLVPMINDEEACNHAQIASPRRVTHTQNMGNRWTRASDLLQVVR